MKGILWVNVPSDLVPARFGRVPHSHVTLKFGVNLNDFSSLLGRQVDVQVVADCWNDDLGVQARHGDVVQEDVAVRRAPDGHPFAREREELPRTAAGQAHREGGPESRHGPGRGHAGIHRGIDGARGLRHLRPRSPDLVLGLRGAGAVSMPTRHC